jgi:hypothetical protein
MSIFIVVKKTVDKFRISVFHSASLTAAYFSTPHSRLVARLDLRNLSASLGRRLFNSPQARCVMGWKRVPIKNDDGREIALPAVDD